VKKKIISLVALTTVSLQAEGLKDAFEKIKTEGELKIGVVRVEEYKGGTASTASLGGSLGIQTAPIKGITLGAKFYTTNPLFGKDNEGLFLDSNNDGYSIIGEAYIQANLAKTTIKAGRQIIDTPFANSDDIGMIPNSFEGYTLVSIDIPNTTVIFASLDKIAGIDAPLPEQFNNIQESSNAVLMGGLVYKGVENTTVQVWHYKLDDADFNYLEAGYETEPFSISGQYTDQDNDNSAVGLTASVNISNFALSVAYNKVDGIVSNGFGGGPFFTSTEIHTIDGTLDQEAILVGVEYRIRKATFAVTHGEFDKGENETDYAISYAVNDNHSLDLIYSNMYDDGTILRFFANYSF
jgi:hypothetical protein